MIAEILLKIRHFYFSLRGIHFHPESVISGVPIRSFRLVGKYSNIYLGKNAEIRSGCYLIARDKIIIGENSTLFRGIGCWCTSCCEKTAFDGIRIIVLFLLSDNIIT